LGPDPAGQKLPTKEEKSEEVLKCWMFYFEAGDCLKRRSKDKYISHDLIFIYKICNFSVIKYLDPDPDPH